MGRPNRTGERRAQVSRRGNRNLTSARQDRTRTRTGRKRDARTQETGRVNVGCRMKNADGFSGVVVSMMNGRSESPERKKANRPAPCSPSHSQSSHVPDDESSSVAFTAPTAMGSEFRSSLCIIQRASIILKQPPSQTLVPSLVQRSTSHHTPDRHQKPTPTKKKVT